jgi:hypothetical protein
VRYLSVLALVVLAGCQPANRESKPVARAATHVATKATTTSATPAPPKSVNKAVLDADGVIFDSRAGKTQEFVFGAQRAEVDAIAERMLGRPDELTENDECGGGPMQFSRYGPLTLNFQDGKLVGWLAREGPQVVTTDGIRPGTFMRDLKVARSARMIEGSTLEGEFDYLAADGNTIGGFAKGEGRDAKIESLYAGVNCFFR